MVKLEITVKMDKKLRHPCMRTELFGYLRELSDIEYQVKNWIPENSSDGIPKSQFDYSIHFLFDDTELSSEAEKCVGWFLHNNNEAKALSSLTNAIEKIFEKYGLNLTDAEYISKPEWSDVVKFAVLALKELESKPDSCDPNSAPSPPPGP